MLIDIKTVATANVVIQILLFILASGAAYLAKNRDLRTHCTCMKVLLPVQMITVAVIMLPSMLGYLKYENPGTFFYSEMLAHHTLGLIVLVIWIYIILTFRTSWMPRNLRAVMRSAFVVWILSLFLGLHMYIRIWT